MKATQQTLYAPCRTYDGNPKHYQDTAASALEDVGIPVSRWAWIRSICDTAECLEPDHLRVASPLKIAYPYGICVYCGRRAATKDHLLPRPWSGDTQRSFVATVPACGTCNSILSDTLTVSITERRMLCHMRLRKKFAKVLRTKDFTPDELAEFEPSLREYICSEMDRKAEVRRMLAWPEDPAYDARALEKSGIEDPHVIGLIRAEDDEDMQKYLAAVM